MSQVPQIRALTAMRGVAAWWVVLFHFRDGMPPVTPSIIRNVAERGYLAVDLFFILSGFVITLNYGSWFARPRLALIRRFLILRLARIYPLHFVVMLLFLINPIAIAMLSHSGHPGPDYSPGYFFMSLLLVQNWGFTHDIYWNVPAWSISTEWFAYLAFPFLAMTLPRFTASAQSALISAAVLLLSIAVGCVALQMTLSTALAQGGLPRCLLEFCLGACVFRLHQLRPALGRRASIWALCSSLVCVAATIAFGLPDYALIPAAFALLIFAFAVPNLTPPRTLPWRVLEWLGQVSYSTYLIHFLLKIWVKFILVRPGVPAGVPFAAYLLAVAAASAVLYSAVELPGRTRLRSFMGEA